MSQAVDVPITFKLSSPVEHGGKTYETLSFREAETGDLILAESVQQGQMARTATMLAILSDVPMPAFKKIKAREFMKILDLTKDFLGNDAADGADATGA